MMTEERINAFIEAGLKRKEAEVLSWFIENGSGSSKQIEIELQMRQPEVSMIVSKFSKAGWLTYKDKRTEGKGRPVKMFYINNTNQILSNFVKLFKQKRDKYDEYIESIENLNQTI